MVRTWIGESWHTGSYTYQVKAITTQSPVSDRSQHHPKSACQHHSGGSASLDPMKAVLFWFTRSLFLILPHLWDQNNLHRHKSWRSSAHLVNLTYSKGCKQLKSTLKGRNRDNGSRGSCFCPEYSDSPLVQGTKEAFIITLNSRQRPRKECLLYWSKGVTKSYIFHQICTSPILPHLFISY